jgi:tetratricopeptide (TPR) repeat protein
LTLLGTVLQRNGETAEAKARYEAALAISREIGSRAAETLALANMISLLGEQMDLEGAKSAHEKAVESSSGMGLEILKVEFAGQKAEFLEAEGKLEEAGKEYEEALAVCRETGFRMGESMTLGFLARLRRIQGDLAAARRLSMESLAIAREIGMRPLSMIPLSVLAAISLAEGRLSEARDRYEQLRAIASELGSKAETEAFGWKLAELAIEEGHPSEAEASARTAVERLKELGRPTPESRALSILALALLLQHKLAEAQDAIGRASAIAEKSRERDLILSVVVTNARVRAASGQPEDAAEAIEKLNVTLEDATKFGFFELQLDARLALGEIELASGRAAEGHARLDALEQEAREQGFGLIARKAAAARKERVSSDP